MISNPKYLWYVIPQANGICRAVGFKPNSTELDAFLAAMRSHDRPYYFMGEAIICMGEVEPKKKKKKTTRKRQVKK